MQPELPRMKWVSYGPPSQEAGQVINYQMDMLLRDGHEKVAPCLHLPFNVLLCLVLLHCLLSLQSMKFLMTQKEKLELSIHMVRFQTKECIHRQQSSIELKVKTFAGPLWAPCGIPPTFEEVDCCMGWENWCQLSKGTWVASKQRAQAGSTLTGFWEHLLILSCPIININRKLQQP